VSGGWHWRGEAQDFRVHDEPVQLDGLVLWRTRVRFVMPSAVAKPLPVTWSRLLSGVEEAWWRLSLWEPWTRPWLRALRHLMAEECREAWREATA
jgi:hypothetical protein